LAILPNGDVVFTEVIDDSSIWREDGSNSVGTDPVDCSATVISYSGSTFSHTHIYNNAAPTMNLDIFDTDPAACNILGYSLLYTDLSPISGTYMIITD